MGLLGLFKSKSFDPAEFEKELTLVTQSISQTKEQIAQLTRKKKTLRRSLSTYFFAIYVSYVAYLYKSSLDNLGVFSAGMGRTSIMFRGQSSRTIAGAILAPFGFGLVIYLLNLSFNAWIRSKSHSLRNLQNKHKEKLEELKQVTNFSKTNQLLRKFDGNASDISLPDQNKQANKIPEKDEPKSVRTNPSKPIGPPPTANINRTTAPKSPNAVPKADTKNRPSTFTAVETGSSKRSFQDRVLDLIIGSDHNESVEQRYALICANCYTHNGLAPPGCTNPFNVTYICRHCGFINGQLHLSSPIESRTISPSNLESTEAVKVHEECTNTHTQSSIKKAGSDQDNIVKPIVTSEKVDT